MKIVISINQGLSIEWYSIAIGDMNVIATYLESEMM